MGKNNLEDIKRDIMASYYHLCSTNEKPRHEYCPPGNDICCNLELFEHPAPLHPDVQKYILPIYEDLSREDILQRCLGGHTQNTNESFNSTIWRFIPKHLHSGLKIIEIAPYLAAGLFNEGYASILQTMSTLEIIIGKQSKTYADKIDDHRVIRQERRSSLMTKEARKARKEEIKTTFSKSV
nr:uncharacterized protein LOC117609681 [Osmia lignaria]